MKATKKREGETNKRKYMSDEAFAELKAAMEEAVAFERERPRLAHHSKSENITVQGRVDREKIPFD